MPEVWYRPGVLGSTSHVAYGCSLRLASTATGSLDGYVS